MPSLPHSLIVTPVVLQVPSPLSWKTGTGSRIIPIIQGEMVSNLLHHLDTQKSMGPNGIHPSVLRELAEVLTKPFSIIYQQSWITRQVPVDWTLARDAHLQERLKGGSGELQACQSDLGAWEGYGADHFKCHHTAHTGQPGDQAQSAGVYEGQVLLD